ncbi:hypothetical protein NDU88_003137 [Pleurodeles waltl]|uniref:Uncharacterized protein n=1 Tax=Pleurodeles waltl TaxID=8319 RepID=A0AAV7SF75_PLEWA|nr:hypothetical protein NDU88_003137 [Pleurodeles waltl]
MWLNLEDCLQLRGTTARRTLVAVCRVSKVLVWPAALSMVGTETWGSSAQIAPKPVCAPRSRRGNTAGGTSVSKSSLRRSSAVPAKKDVGGDSPDTGLSGRADVTGAGAMPVGLVATVVDFFKKSGHQQVARDNEAQAAGRNTDLSMVMRLGDPLEPVGLCTLKIILGE